MFVCIGCNTLCRRRHLHWPCYNFRSGLRVLDAIYGVEWLVEEFVQGESYSVSAVFHQDGFTMLPPWRQELGGIHDFEYVGGSLCEDQAVIERLNKWAFTVFAALPSGNSRGWISLDAVMAKEKIYLMEVNPRITASFDSLCQLSSFAPYQGLQSTNVTDLMSAAIWGND